MTVLGIDSGLATFGWALLDEDTLEPLNLGVIVTKPNGDLPVTLDRSLRLLTQTDVVIEAVRGCRTVVIEQMSFPPGGANAISAISLSYGAAVGVIAALNPRPRMLTISPQKWQRLVLETDAKKVDYETVYAAGCAFVQERAPKVYASLLTIPAQHRNHAIDAMLLALVGAMRPDACFEVIARDTFTGKRSKALHVVKPNGYPDYQAERNRRMTLVLGDYPDFEMKPGVPATRDQCKDGPRPCPYVTCRHHLWLLLQEDRAGNPLRKAGTTLLPQSGDSCSLDVAERLGALSESKTAEVLGIDKSRVRSILRAGLTKLRDAGLNADELER